MNKKRSFKNRLREYVEKKEKKYSNKEKVFVIAIVLVFYIFFLFYNFFSQKKENLNLGSFKGLSKEKLEVENSLEEKESDLGEKLLEKREEGIDLKKNSLEKKEKKSEGNN